MELSSAQKKFSKNILAALLLEKHIKVNGIHGSGGSLCVLQTIHDFANINKKINNILIIYNTKSDNQNIKELLRQFNIFENVDVESLTILKKKIF